MADASIKQLEAEIEQLNRLVVLFSTFFTFLKKSVKKTYIIQHLSFVRYVKEKRIAGAAK